MYTVVTVHEQRWYNYSSLFTISGSVRVDKETNMRTRTNEQNDVGLPIEYKTVLQEQFS